MKWATFEAALDGADDASAVLDALIASSMGDFQESLVGIGAGEAGRLLAEARTADAPERRSKLAAGLDIIDRCLAANAPAAKRRGLLDRAFGRAYDWNGRTAHYGDMAWAGLAACLIASELGGDAEALRSRAALVATAFESDLAVQRDLLAKKDLLSEGSAGRRVLLKVFKILMKGMASPSAG